MKGLTTVIVSRWGSVGFEKGWKPEEKEIRDPAHWIEGKATCDVE